jgi:tetratricopeptide (TPR) repeat protein
MTENDNLRAGIAAAKSGDLERARGYLARAVRENPSSEEGWLWLGKCLEDKQQRKYCYEKVLQLNPQNREARNELDRLFPAQETETSTPVKATLPKTPPVPTPHVEKKTDWKSNPVLVSILGLLLGLCVCGLPIFFLIRSGLLSRFNMPTQPQTLVMPTVTPFELASPVPTPSFTPTPTLIANNLPATETPQPLISVETNMMQIQSLMAQEKYADAVLLLDQVIQSAPESDEAYYQRAMSYRYLMEHQRSEFEYEEYLEQGLADIDQAIAIRPDHGDYYMLRESLLAALAGQQNYRVDTQHITKYALENASAALNLGATLEKYPDRIYVSALIFTDRCEEASQRLQEMIDQTDPNSPSIGGLYRMQSQAFICLGDTKKALQMIDKSMFNNIDMDLKNGFKAEYLYQAGRRSEALQLLNTLIEEKPNYDGWRYYLRALIYQEMGEREKAEEDLMMGAGNTWWHAGLFLYVQGKMALEDGNKEEAITLLQEAEASLGVGSAPLQARIRAELKELGAQPLEITPSVMLNVTSMPTMQARPTERPLDTPVALATSQVAAAENLGSSLPIHAETAIIIDLATGSGKLTLLPDDYPLFRFQPGEPISVKEVKNLVLHVIPGGNEPANPEIQIYMWGTDGGWGTIAPTWGNNPIDQPQSRVLPEGDIFLAIRNVSTRTVVLDKLSITLVVETLDGAIKTYGEQ